MTVEKDRYRQLVESLPDAYAYHKILLDETGTAVDYIILDINTAYERMTGLRREEIQGKKAAALLSGIENEAFDWAASCTRLALAGGESTHLESYAEPLERWYEIRSNRDGPDILTMFFRDITETRLAAEALQKREEQLRQLIESQSELIYRYLPDGTMTFVNEACCSYFGKGRDELLGRPFLQLIPEEDLHQLKKHLAALNRDNPVGTFEHRLILPNGDLRWQQRIDRVFCNEQEEIVEYQAVVRDITEQKLMEEELQNSQEQLQAILSFLPDATFVIDLEGKVLVWNKAMEEMTGIKEEEIIGKGDYEYTIPFYGERRPCMADMVLEQNIEFEKKYSGFTRSEDNTLVAEAFSPFIGESGAYMWVKATPLYDNRGKIIGVIESIRDITDRKLAEDARRDALRRLDDIIEFLPDATVVIDKQSTVIAWNKAIEEMTGVPKKDMLGKGDYEYAIPFYGERRPILVNLALLPRDEQEELLKKNYDIGRTRDDTLYGEVYCPETYGGKGAYLFASASKLRDASGEVVGAIETIRDITDRKLAEHKIANYNRELERLYRLLDEEMEKARSIHERAFPAEIPAVQGISLAAYYQPAQKLGGDFYDVIKSGSKLVLYLSDVMGHGMDGAMLSVFVKEAINSFISLRPDDICPEKILRHLNTRYRQENFPEEYLIGILVAVLDLETLQLSCSGAGFQTSPLVRLENGEFFSMSSRGLPISSVIDPELLDFQTEKLFMPPGTTVFFSTDGLAEQTSKEKLYNDRLTRVFAQHGGLPPFFFNQVIKEDFRNFNAGSLQGGDDITFVTLQVDREKKEQNRLELASHPESLRELQEAAAQILPDVSGAKNLLSGLHELAANAMEHGNRFAKDKKVFVEIIVAGNILAATVEDQGEGFDWQQKLYNSLNLENARERGRGIIMTKMLCEGLFYNEQGNLALLFMKGERY